MIISTETTNKETKKIAIVMSKRMTWNSRRKYNYKYITTVF
ncbi:hypothetical protein [uncultured Polaribacter sp.]|nr:hypothetical protein [uncultured Polaribacter sp.]